jgi:hypothetical protein
LRREGRDVIHVNGNNGESITLDGPFVHKFQHHGKDEAARNLASTYRNSTIKARKRKGGAAQEYDVMIACSSFVSLTITESERPRLDELITELERITSM